MPELTEKEIQDIIKKSYYTDLKTIKEYVLKKTGLKGYQLFNITFSGTRLFLIHFDALTGPVVASSKRDDTIANKLNIEPSDEEKEEFLKVASEELINVMAKISDLEIASENQDYEFILKKGRKNFFFRHIEVSNPLARGNVENFLLILLTNSLKREKFDKAAEIMKELLSKYFKLFERGYDNINEGLIKPVINHFAEKDYTPNEIELINKFYEINS